MIRCTDYSELEKSPVYDGGDVDNMSLKSPDSPMTVRHLLGHMAGLSYGWSDHPVDEAYRRRDVSRGRCDPCKFRPQLSELPLVYSPGTQWRYSLATDVCGHLVEALSGQPLDEYFASTFLSRSV